MRFVCTLLILAFGLPFAAAQPAPAACLHIALTETRLDEGGAVAYIVTLPAAPAAGETVTVSASAANAQRLTITPESRTFDASNWQTGRIFTLSVRDDAVNDPDVIFTTLTHTSASSDSQSPLHELAACQDFTLTLADNDDGITLRPTATPPPTSIPPTATPDRSSAGIYFDGEIDTVTLNTGESVDITVHTNTPPRMDETFTIFPLYDPAQIAASPSIREVTFSTWGDGRIFTFTPIPDPAQTAPRIVTVTFYVTSSDPYSRYFNLVNAARLTVTIQGDA
ncbi:MAG: hypothetical protein SF162_11810 [bacterium]|nr:hypothetical protein [bacterium]